MKAKTYTNQQVAAELDKYSMKYYRGNSAAFGKSEGFDQSYLRKMCKGIEPVNARLLPLIGFERIGKGQYRRL